MNFKVEVEQEQDGRWIAEVVELPGVMAYGSTPQEACAKVQALALSVADPDLPDPLPLTEAQRAELDRRLAAHLRDPGAARAWPDVRDELKRKK
jgi:putative addiction module component (TIGR02574 family)